MSDSLTRLKNAQIVKKTKVSLLYSQLVSNVLCVLQNEGYIISYQRILLRKGVAMLNVFLKYQKKSNQPAIKEISVISKPGRRVYSHYHEIKSFYGGLGMTVVSTSKGVIPDREAINRQVGGELICKVF
jgi:small subunit ribosomal protein S8